jgi:hypothetical protein
LTDRREAENDSGRSQCEFGDINQLHPSSYRFQRRAADVSLRPFVTMVVAADQPNRGNYPVGSCSIWQRALGGAT